MENLVSAAGVTVTVITREWADGRRLITSTATSSHGTLVIDVDTFARTAAITLPSGRIEVRRRPNGTIDSTVIPQSGPSFTGTLQANGAFQSSGDLATTMAAFPELTGTFGADLVQFGMSTGLIHVASDGTYAASIPVSQQSWGAGSRCNEATILAIAAALVFAGNMAGCIISAGWKCATALGTYIYLLHRLAEEYEICSTFNN